MIGIMFFLKFPVHGFGLYRQFSLTQTEVEGQLAYFWHLAEEQMTPSIFTLTYTFFPKFPATSLAVHHLKNPNQLFFSSQFLTSTILIKLVSMSSYNFYEMYWVLLYIDSTTFKIVTCNLFLCSLVLISLKVWLFYISDQQDINSSLLKIIWLYLFTIFLHLLGSIWII